MAPGVKSTQKCTQNYYNERFSANYIVKNPNAAGREIPRTPAIINARAVK